MNSSVRVLVAALAAVALLATACSAPAAPAPTSPPAKPPQQPAAAPTAAPQPAATKPAPPPTAQPTPLAKKTISVGYATTNANYSDVYAAQAKGFFADEALTVEESLCGGSAKCAQTLLAGGLDVSAFTPDVSILVAQSGGDPMAVAANIMSQTYFLVVSKRVNTWEDLRGKVIGVAGLTGTEPAFLKQLMAKHGLTAGKDYDLRVVGATPEKVAALTNGSIDGSTVYPPQCFQMEDAGFKILGTTEEIGKASSTNWVVRKGWARQNEDTLLRFLRGIYRAHVWLANPANRAEAVKLIADRTKTEQKYAERLYDLFWVKEKLYSPDGSMPTSVINVAQEILAGDGELKQPVKGHEEYIDLSYLKKAMETVKR